MFKKMDNHKQRSHRRKPMNQVAFVSVIWLLFGALRTFSAQAQSGKTSCEIILTNKSRYAIANKVVELPWEKIASCLLLADTSYPAVSNISGELMDYQIEKGADGKPVHLLIQVSLKPGEVKRLGIKKSVHRTFAARTYGRYVPERYGDFAWENDKVAFRVFGKELEATTFNAKGIDVWVKSTPKLVINKWYQSEDYHVDHGEGLDFYGVGYTLGAGGCAPVWEDSIWLGPNYSKYEILENGPLRTKFSLYYDAWAVGSRQVSCKKTYTLDAGSYFNKIEVEYVTGDGEPVEVAMGINTRPGDDVRLINQRLNCLGYWLPADSVNGTIGVGVILPESSFATTQLKGHVASTCMVKSNEPFTYYAGSCWDKPGPFKSSEAWFEYVQQEARNHRENESITITIKKK